MKKFAYFIVALLILVVSLHGYAYLFSNFILSSILDKLKNSSEFRISSIDQNSSIFSTNLNFALKYKDFDLKFDIISHHSVISIFNGIEIIVSVDDLGRSFDMASGSNLELSKKLAKFNLDIPINGGVSQLSGQISPVKIIENHNLFTISSIPFNATLDAEHLYFFNIGFDRMDFELDGISGTFSGANLKIDYLDGLEFANFDLFKLSPNELNFSVENLRASIAPINIVSDGIKFSSKTTTKNLANITSYLQSKGVMINGVMLGDIESKIRANNLILDSYRVLFGSILGFKSVGLIDAFISSKPILYVDKLGVSEFFDLKFSIISDGFEIRDVNLDGEFRAWRRISTLKGLEFLSFYENFLISSGILIENGNGYIAKFKSHSQSGEIIFNNSMKFSDILADF